MVISRTTDCAVSVSSSMLPTLAPIFEMEASKRASVPVSWMLRTRTVRMSRLSHAITYSFRIPHFVFIVDYHLLPSRLYNLDHGTQLIERFDRCAIRIREDTARVVEDGLQSRAPRPDHVRVIIVADVD